MTMTFVFAAWSRLAMIATLAGLAITDTAGAPAPGGQNAAVAEFGTIRGRVTDRSGAPIRSAEVRLRAEEGRDDRLFTTDVDGKYEISDVSPGGWRLSASKAGFVTQAYGQAHPRDMAVPLKLASGQRLTADIVLLRGGAISGTVLDENGDPLGGVRVSALRLRSTQGRRQLVDTGVVDISDDTGAFRLYGLVPDNYAVAALGLRLYHGGSDDPADALFVTVRAGEETPGVTLAVPPPPANTVPVSGQVLREDGAPLAGGLVHLVPRSTMTAPLSSGRASTADRDGRFRLEGVKPGAYFVTATATLPGLESGGARAAVPIDVGSSEIRDLVVTLTPARTLDVVIATESGQALPAPFLVRVALEAVDGGGTSSFRTMDMGNRLTLQLPNVWGRQRLTVRTERAGWYVARIEAGGAPLADGELDSATLPAAAIVRVVVTNRAGTLAGTVQQDNRGRRGTVVVFADDPETWDDAAPYVLLVRTDADGRYRLPGVPPGVRYRAVAVSYLEPDEETDPAFLKSMRNAGTTFEVREGEQRQLDLLLLQR